MNAAAVIVSVVLPIVVECKHSKGDEFVHKHTQEVLDTRVHTHVHLRVGLIHSNQLWGNPFTIFERCVVSCLADFELVLDFDSPGGSSCLIKT